MIREMDWEGAKPDYLRRDASSLPAWVVNSKGVSLLPQHTTTLGTTQPIPGEQVAAACHAGGPGVVTTRGDLCRGDGHAFKDALVGGGAGLGGELGKALTAQCHHLQGVCTLQG